MFEGTPEYVPQIGVKKVLLLEDDRHFAAFLQELLRLRNYQVTAVPNGADGVREVLRTDFDAIICDMLMPTMPGDMFYLAVQRTKPHLCARFVFITGNSANARVREFIEQTNGVLLTKPFRPEDLTTALKKIELANRQK